MSRRSNSAIDANNSANISDSISFVFFPFFLNFLKKFELLLQYQKHNNKQAQFEFPFFKADLNSEWFMATIFG